MLLENNIEHITNNDNSSLKIENMTGSKPCNPILLALEGTCGATRCPKKRRQTTPGGPLKHNTNSNQHE